jgi:hypothetical protein
MPSYETPIGSYATVTDDILPGSPGEVSVAIRQGSEIFTALAFTRGDTIGRHEQVVVIVDRP